MKVFAVTGNSEIASVYMADMGDGKLIEFVEALQPPYRRDERWILMVSTLFGCPIKCMICDAGSRFRGKPGSDDIVAQIDYMVDKWYPDRHVPASKFKIQFARMGEPTLNKAVLDVMRVLPERYIAPGLIPSLSTVAPKGCDSFLDALLDIKNELYHEGRFQLQFSIHTTDETLRDQIIPVKKWSFEQIAKFGKRFIRPGDRKITLNFALAKGMTVDPAILLNYFDPTGYLIKITPVNPTCQAVKNGLASYIDPYQPNARNEIASKLMDAHYEVIISIGQVKENQIGSNCGQYVLKYLEGKVYVRDGYTYRVEAL